MSALIRFILQEDTAAASAAADGIPELGVRISVWVIGVFLLAVGGAIVWLRMRGSGPDRGR